MSWLSFLSFKPKAQHHLVSQTMEKDMPVLPKSDRGGYLPRESCRVRSLRWVIPWIPHFILFALYTALFTTWPIFRPQFITYDVGTPMVYNKPWMARFDGTFLEIGDFFNVSHTKDMSSGAKAAWQNIQKYKIHDFAIEEANKVRVTTAHVESPDPGDPRVLSKLHRLHCLHILWRRWHGQTTEEEAKANITREVHDNHCFEILRYGLMCDDEIRIKQVGWPAIEALHSGVMDVDRYCSDPEKDGIEKKVTGT